MLCDVNSVGCASRQFYYQHYSWFKNIFIYTTHTLPVCEEFDGSTNTMFGLSGSRVRGDLVIK